MMNRRQFIKASSIGAVAVGIAGTALWLNIEEYQGDLSIEGSLALLNSLDTMQINSLGEWNIAQIFTHCAQSVEFSMIGFPAHKSALFKSTLGSAAFNAFNTKGKMRHNLSEAIPGAQVLKPNEDVQLAKTRFTQAMQNFKQYTGELAEHFAYGKLNKQDYERAHAMHFNNHLLEIVQTKP